MEDDVFVDYAVYPKSLDDISRAAIEAENGGYDTYWVRRRRPGAVTAELT